VPEPPSAWTLITVLLSTFPLSPALAGALHQAAWTLYRSGETRLPLAGDFGAGHVLNLKKRALLGHLGGPVFEAQLQTERGKGQVRFFLTEQGISLLEQAERPPLPN
jgi:hypothetical protein